VLLELLYLVLVFNIDHTNAMAYANAARNLCSGPAERVTLPSFCSAGGDAVRPAALELLGATGGH
jgi:hypothetical protein